MSEHPNIRRNPDDEDPYETDMARHGAPGKFSQIEAEEQLEAAGVAAKKELRERQREHLWRDPGCWTVLG